MTGIGRNPDPFGPPPHLPPIRTRSADAPTGSGPRSPANQGSPPSKRPRLEAESPSSSSSRGNSSPHGGFDSSSPEPAYSSESPSPRLYGQVDENSPTYVKLDELNRKERENRPDISVPDRFFPAGTKTMTPHEAAAADLFINNLTARGNAAASRGRCENEINGEFIQAYRYTKDRVIATGPMVWEEGGSVQLPLEAYPGANLFIHSHPPEGPSSMIPSDGDYFQTYWGKAVSGGTAKNGMIFHAEDGSFSRFKGKIYEDTGMPKYKVAVHPSPAPFNPRARELNEWPLPPSAPSGGSAGAVP